MGNEESEVVAILKPEENIDESITKASKLSTQFSVKSVEDNTETPKSKTSIASRFSIRSVSKDESTQKMGDDTQGLMNKLEPHHSQSRFVVTSVGESDEQLPYETDDDQVFTEPDDHPITTEIMEEVPELTVLPNEFPNLPMTSSGSIQPIPEKPSRFTISLIKTNGPDNQASVKLNEIQEDEVFC